MSGRQLAIQGAVLVGVAAGSAWLYARARGESAVVGFDAATVAHCLLHWPLLFGVFGVLPLAGALFAGVAAVMARAGSRPHRWWRRGHCPACGYPRTAGVSDRCPECGTRFGRPPAMGEVRLYLMCLLLPAFAGWLVGAAAGEWWVLEDELRFRDEASAFAAGGGVGIYTRSYRL